MIKSQWLTVTKQKILARKVAAQVWTKPSSRQLGEARQCIVEMVDAEPRKYIEFHAAYCTPKSDDLIIKDAAALLNNQGRLL